jgi:hypothetical protein
MTRTELWVIFMHAALSGVSESSTVLPTTRAAERADLALKEFEKRFGPGAGDVTMNIRHKRG